MSAFMLAFYRHVAFHVAAVGLAAAAGAGSTGDESPMQADLSLEAGQPHLVPLQRESVPVLKNGRTVAYKSAYHGRISVGGPTPQEFSVIFDTGSGHVVVPSTDCESEACQSRRKYNFTASEQGVGMSAAGEPVGKGQLSDDQVTIGYGTGTIVGDLVRDVVCAGEGPGRPCAMVTVVAAVEMSREPFSSFGFDGIFGLGLTPLALGSFCSFFGQFAARDPSPMLPRFGLFLNRQGSGGGGSELALGGFNAQRVRGPLSWVPVVQPTLGYWMVEVRAIRIDGVELPSCKGGRCKAILDTGTSHVGVPSKLIKKMRELLAPQRPAPASPATATSMSAAPALLAQTSANLGCRVRADGSDEAKAWPQLTFELPGFDVVLRPEDYLRAPDAQGAASPGGTAALPLPDADLPPCKPRLTPVALPAPLGSDIFVLGEPVLQRYYTVFDWATPRVAFGEARRPSLAADRSGEDLADAEEEALAALEAQQPPAVVLLQVTFTLAPRL